MMQRLTMVNIGQLVILLNSETLDSMGFNSLLVRYVDYVHCVYDPVNTLHALSGYRCNSIVILKSSWCV